MMKPVLTKYCVRDEQEHLNTNSFEKKFENYIEYKVRKIFENPEKYPYLKVIKEK